MKPVLAFFIAFALTPAVLAQDVVEPRSGAKFPAKIGDLALTGLGLRTKTFLKVKVYAIGLYVADVALAGPLAAHKGKPKTAAFYKDLLAGDFAKEVHLQFLRDLSADQIQGAFRETLAGADKARVEAFVSYFGELKTGQECVLRSAPGGTLETLVAGAARLPIADTAFTTAVFSIWLGDKPIQEDIKIDLVKQF
jgi:hypothetical protein